MKVSCPMYLKVYPMDTQTCNVQMESYGYTTDDIVFTWYRENPVQRSENLALPEFSIEGLDTSDCTEEYITGAFSCLNLELFFKRHLGFYLIQMYVPSILIVILSWVSFWIDIEAVPARITLGLLTVLTMTTQMSGITMRLPRVSYIKAIDIWQSVGLVFVFGALIEYSVVNVFARKHAGRQRMSVVDSNGSVTHVRDFDDLNSLTLKKRKFSVRRNSVALPASNGYKPESGSSSTEQATKSSTSSVRLERQDEQDTTPSKSTTCTCKGWWTHDNRAKTVDLVSRVLFPVVYLIFNLFYWICYGVLIT